MLGVASTLLIGVLCKPLRRCIQSFIVRRVYTNKYDARKTLEAFSAKPRDETDLDTLNERAAHPFDEGPQSAPTLFAEPRYPNPA